MKKSKIKYEDILSYQKIYNTYFDIKRTTKNKRVLLYYQQYLNSNIYNLLVTLYKKNICFGKYNIFLIKEPKYRIIMSQNISDKIINHLIAKYFLLPSLEPGLIDTNVATRKNKGSSYAYETVKKIVRKLSTHKKIFVLKLDIAKYFYNIDHSILYSFISKKIKDKNCLFLIKNLLNTTDENYINEEITKLIENEIIRLSKSNNNEESIKELKKIPLYKRGKGLPLGNMTSQILAIFYLDILDKYIKETLKYKHYVRYMDDLLIFSNDKERLALDLDKINEVVKSLKLELNSKSKLLSLNNGIDFVGYRFLYNGKKLIIKYKKKTYQNIKKRLKNKKKYNYKEYLLSKSSYKGYLIKTNTIYKCMYKNIEKESSKRKISSLIEYYNNNVVIFKNNNKFFIYAESMKIIKKYMNFSTIKNVNVFSEIRIIKIKNILRENNIGFVVISGNTFKEEIY